LLGHDPVEARRAGDVALAGHDQCRGGDLAQPVHRVIGHPGGELPLEGLGRLRVREGQRLLDDLVHRPVLVGAFSATREQLGETQGRGRLSPIRAEHRRER
jgi:hypothetical protein